ncbi:hypothetical protein JCM10908_004414 [Rhodotorula pacifica]|uniref:uncharacterized protein n=1 Tax=Rhodotorula pacifica TaxID=1495444 RepID=UPI00317F7F51
MPYANPPSSSSSTSVATMTLEAPMVAPPVAATTTVPSPRLAAASSPRIEHKRPARHHQRSHSSEPVASTSSFIFVQPPTPNRLPNGAVGSHASGSSSSSSASNSPSTSQAHHGRLSESHRSHSWSTSSPYTSSSSSASTSPSFDTLPRTARRLKLTALTPAAPSPPLPSSKPAPTSSSASSSSSRPPAATRTSSSGSSSSAEEVSAAAERAAAARSPGSTPAYLSGAPSASSTASSSAMDMAFPYNEVTPTGSPRSSSSVLTSADEGYVGKPAMMVRKKSGELVRPSLKADGSRRDYSKPRSAPATPICPKYVHFDTQLEHVKHFIAQQRPAAVSRTGSPIETETEEEPEAYPFPAMVQPQAGTVKLVLPNFPTVTARAAADKDAWVDSLEMDKDGKNIKGTVRVKNLAFEKWVAIRFTLDHWRTVSEVSAEYLDSPPSKAGAQDRFTFTIKLQDLLSRIEDKTMFLAVRYTVGGREIWDNNDGQNYRIEFRKVPASSASGAAATAVAARAMAARSGAGAPNGSAAAHRRAAWSVTSAGQAADRMADLRRELDRLVSDDAFDDDEIPSDGSDSRRNAAALAAAGGGAASGMHIGGVSGLSNGAAAAAAGGAASRAARFGLGMDVRSYSDTVATAPVTLSGRYDFGNSLKMYAAPVAPNGSTGVSSSGMKPRTQASPRFATGTLTDAASARAFFDPVSTSPQRPRAPPLPARVSPPQAGATGYATQIIGGQPATVLPPVDKTRPSLDSLAPDFGVSSPRPNGAVSGIEVEPSTGLSKAYFSPTSPVTSEHSHGPPPSWFLPIQDATTYGNGQGGQRLRVNTAPAESEQRAEFSPRGGGYAQMVPPNFRQQHGIFVHPNHMSPFATPDDSPAPSPPMHAGRQLRSPPPSVPESPVDGGDGGGISPAASLLSDTTARATRGQLRRDGSESSTSSTVSSVLSSPESEATSLGGGPDSPATLSFGKAAARPNSALEFSRFLDRYRFHLGGDGSESSSASNSPPHDFLSFTPTPNKAVVQPGSVSSTSSSVNSSGANSPTPRHHSPLIATVSVSVGGSDSG